MYVYIHISRCPDVSKYRDIDTSRHVETGRAISIFDVFSEESGSQIPRTQMRYKLTFVLLSREEVLGYLMVLLC